MYGFAVLLASSLWTYWLAGRLISLYRERDVIKENFRGEPVTPALGPALLLGYLFTIAAATWLGDGNGETLYLTVPVLLGVSLFGLWDDMMNDCTSGFRGHFGTGLKGKMTAGLLKVVTALLVAAIFAGRLPLPTPQRLLALLLILVSANGLNLLDRRPGRAIKVFYIIAAAIIALANAKSDAISTLLPLMAVTLVVTPLDLHAGGMLGDCGSNLLGAFLGVAAIFFLVPAVQIALLFFWLLLHILSEFVSISSIIEKNFLLRYLDNLGRPRNNLP